MEFLNQDLYKSKNFSFPDMENTSEEEKNNPSYNLAMGKYVWSLYLKDKTAIPYSKSDYYNMFRLYAHGRQPSSIYKSYLSGDTSTKEGVSEIKESNNRSFQTEGWMNVDFDNIFTFMPKLCRILEGYFSDVDWEVQATSPDPDSGAEEEVRMLRYWANSLFEDKINEVAQVAGLPPINMQYKPESLNELEILKEEGMFKRPFSMDLEKLIKYTEDKSNWRTMSIKMLADLRDYGFCASIRRYNEETCTEEWVYFNPLKVICQYSENFDFSDSDFRGYVESVSISELRRKGFSEEELSDLCKKTEGLYGNPNEDEWNSKTIINEHKIDILYIEWIDVVDERKIRYQTKNGGVRLLDYNKTINERRQNKREKYLNKKGTMNGYSDMPDEKYISNKEKVEDRRIRLTRSCKWIIGSDLVYDYGIKENQLRFKHNKPECSIKLYKIPGRPMTDVLTKACDLYNIAALQFENGLSRAVQEGYAVDKSVLLSDGKHKTDPLKALQMHKETGYFIYNGMPNGVNRGGTPVPITYLPGTLGQNMMTSISIMDRCMRFVEDLTGFSPIALGGTPSKDTQVGTQEMSMRSTQASLRPYEEAIKTIKQQLSEASAEAIQLAIKYDNKAREIYETIIGKEGIQRIKTAKKFYTQYGFKLVPKPRESKIRELIGDINLAYQKKQQGMAGLNEAEKAQLIFEIDNGANMTHLLYKMNYWIRRDEKRLQDEKEKMIAMQGQSNNQMKEIEGKNSIELEKQRMRNILIETNIKSDLKKVEMNLELRNKLVELVTSTDEQFKARAKEAIIQKNLEQMTEAPVNVQPNQI
jgi:hypothetical protein